MFGHDNHCKYTHRRVKKSKEVIKTRPHRKTKNTKHKLAYIIIHWAKNKNYNELV
jgi:hypothetical protein